MWSATGKLILARPLLWMLLKICWSLSQIWDHVYVSTHEGSAGHGESLTIWIVGGRMAWVGMSLFLQKCYFLSNSFSLATGSEDGGKMLHNELDRSPGWDILSRITAGILGAAGFKREWKRVKERERQTDRHRERKIVVERDRRFWFKQESRSRFQC